MKNTKIMAVLVVLLAAALFAGSVTAADMTNDKDFANITADVNSLTAAKGFVSEDIKIFNKTALSDTTNVNVTVDWGDGTIKTYESALDVDKQYSIDLKHYYADGKNSHTITIQGNKNITQFWYEGGLNNLISIDVSECTTLSYLVADSNLKSFVLS